jgi:YegS/Rv2252/BmrU family lipid kinase
MTQGAGDATRLAARALSGGPRPVIAVGGDGTLNEVLNGLLEAGGPVTLGVAPYGTGNDWARELGIPAAPAALCALLVRRKTRRVDVGRIEYQDGGRRAARFFINVAGVGYDAYVLEHMWRRGPRLPAYLVALTRGLVTYRAPSFTVRAAGRSESGSLFVALAMLGQSCGGGMRFAPHARPDDGLMDLVTIDHLGPLAALRRLPKIYRGTILEDRAVRFRQCPEADVEAEPPARVEADGQLLGTTPVAIRVLPGAIDFLVP